MGMGEPMMNLDAVLAAARRLPDVGDHAPPHDDLHRRLAARASTPLRRRGEVPIRLALSLHAPDDALRAQLMPVNERYPLAEVLAACRRYFELPAPQVFVEYVMLAGVNDRSSRRAQLARAARPAGTTR